MKPSRRILLLLSLPALTLSAKEKDKEKDDQNPQPANAPAHHDAEKREGSSWISVTPKGPATVTYDGWLKRTFTIQNRRKKDFFIYGYSKTFPFIGIEMKDPKTGNWVKRPMGYCGTGATMFPVKPGETLSTTITLPPDQADREFAFSPDGFSAPEGGNRKTMESPSLWMGGKG